MVPDAEDDDASADTEEESRSERWTRRFLDVVEFVLDLF
jgi:hypothetical protein